MRTRGIASRAVLAALALLVAAPAAGCSFDSPPEYVPPPNADLLLGCSLDCHGDDTSNAPPKSMSGALETTSVAVGAHRVHLNVASTWHREVKCGDCHVVPAEVDSPGHLDGDNKAEVTFAMIAGDNAAWNGTTCVTRCHGSVAKGGAQPTPTWTQVDGTQATCGSCHGKPPPAPHPTGAQAAQCATCHPTMDVGGTTFLDPSRHIDGIIDSTEPGATGGCSKCHGSDTSTAPPKDLTGNTDHTARGVGAHTAHLKASTWHRAVPCVSCHVVPTRDDAPGHRDAVPGAEVIFDNLNRNALYAPVTALCTNLYCHGNGRGSNGTAPAWTAAGPLACNACHKTDGKGMSGQHEKHIGAKKLPCSTCHQAVVNASMVIIAPTGANLHINGVHDVKMAAGTYNAQSGTCSGLGQGCHGPKEWDEDRDRRGPLGGPLGGRGF